MVGMLWYAISHPNLIAGRDGLGRIVLISAVIAMMTLGFMALVGRQILRYSRVLAVLAGTAILPLSLVALAFLAARNDPPGTDAGGMLIAISIVGSVWMVPVTLATSIVYVAYRTRFHPSE